MPLLWIRMVSGSSASPTGARTTSASTSTSRSMRWLRWTCIVRVGCRLLLHPKQARACPRSDAQCPSWGQPVEKGLKIVWTTRALEASSANRCLPDYSVDLENRRLVREGGRVVRPELRVEADVDLPHRRGIEVPFGCAGHLDGPLGVGFARVEGLSQGGPVKVILLVEQLEVHVEPVVDGVTAGQPARAHRHGLPAEIPAFISLGIEFGRRLQRARVGCFGPVRGHDHRAAA